MGVAILLMFPGRHDLFHLRDAQRVCSGPARGPQRVSMRGEMGSHGPPQAPIFCDFSFLAIFTCFHGNSAYLRPCYHALRQPVGAADRAMLHN